MKMPCYSVCSLLFFCLDPTLGKDIWMRASSATVMVKVLFWKLLDHNYGQSSFSRIAWHIENSILKEILQLKSIYVLILLSRLEQTSRNENQLRCLEIYHLQKNMTPHFKEYCTKIDDISLIVISFFFSQTNLVFKSTWHFGWFLAQFVYVLTFLLLIFYGFWRSSSASTPSL